MRKLLAHSALSGRIAKWVGMETPGGTGGYLTWAHFLQMLGLAAVVHIVAMVGLGLLPGANVVSIPVRVLNIKLGNSDAPEQGQFAGKTGEEYNLDQDGAEETVATVTSLPEIDMQQPVAEAEYAMVLKSFEDALNTKKQMIESLDDKSLADLLGEERPKKAAAAPKKASAKLPKQFVREGSDSKTKVEGSVLGDSTAIDAEILARYEQLISKWIQRFKQYPQEAKNSGVEGAAIVRVRINRKGDVLFFRLEQKTGHQLLDVAILDMIKQANPLPPVPENYPAGNMLEFLIPVSFKLQP